VQIKRNEIDNLHELQIFECPVSVLVGLAREADVAVTVENVTPMRSVDRWFDSKLAIMPGGALGNYSVRNFTFDVALSNSEFIDLEPFWDSNGAYALFTERSPIGFKASGLELLARHKALANYGLVLEFALAGPASDDWSRIVSPQASLLDLAESLLGEI